MKDFLGKDLKPGQIVVQAAASGHHKYLKLAVVLKVNDEDEYVKVQSESRPGDVTWVDRRLMILDDVSLLEPERIEGLKKIFVDWKNKNEA